MIAIQTIVLLVFFWQLLEQIIGPIKEQHAHTLFGVASVVCCRLFYQGYLSANVNPRVDLAVPKRSPKKNLSLYSVVRQWCTHLHGNCYIIDGRVVWAFKHIFNMKFKYGFELEFSVFKDLLAMISMTRQMRPSCQLLPLHPPAEPSRC